MFLKTERENTSDKSHYENVPFEIPESWEWTTVEEVTPSLQYGTSEKYFEAFQIHHSDSDEHESLRHDVLRAFVRDHGLTATMYQNYGWPAKELICLVTGYGES